MTTYQRAAGLGGADSAACRSSARLRTSVGDLQVRSRGTLGGSLAHADPAADLTAVVLALGGAGQGGRQRRRADDRRRRLFVDMLTTSLEPDEVITEIAIPAAAGKGARPTRSSRHPASGYAVVGVAAMLTVDGDSLPSARIAVTGATGEGDPRDRGRAGADRQAARPPRRSPPPPAWRPTVWTSTATTTPRPTTARHLVGVYARRAIERAAAQARG